MGELCVRASFSIADISAINLLLRTSFIDGYIRKIFSEKHKLVP